MVFFVIFHADDDCFVETRTTTVVFQLFLNEDVRDIFRVFFSVRHRRGPPTQSEQMLKGKTLLMKELSQKSRMSMSTLTSVNIEENDGSKTSDSFDIEMALDAPERCRRRALAEPRA